MSRFLSPTFMKTDKEDNLIVINHAGVNAARFITSGQSLDFGGTETMNMFLRIDQDAENTFSFLVAQIKSCLEYLEGWEKEVMKKMDMMINPEAFLGENFYARTFAMLHINDFLCFFLEVLRRKNIVEIKRLQRIVADFARLKIMILNNIFKAKLLEKVAKSSSESKGEPEVWFAETDKHSNDSPEDKITDLIRVLRENRNRFYSNREIISVWNKGDGYNLSDILNIYVADGNDFIAQFEKLREILENLWQEDLRGLKEEDERHEYLKKLREILENLSERDLREVNEGEKQAGLLPLCKLLEDLEDIVTQISFLDLRRELICLSIFELGVMDDVHNRLLFRLRSHAKLNIG